MLNREKIKLLEQLKLILQVRELIEIEVTNANDPKSRVYLDHYLNIDSWTYDVQKELINELVSNNDTR